MKKIHYGLAFLFLVVVIVVGLILPTEIFKWYSWNKLNEVSVGKMTVHEESQNQMLSLSEKISIQLKYKNTLNTNVSQNIKKQDKILKEQLEKKISEFLKEVKGIEIKVNVNSWSNAFYMEDGKFNKTALFWLVDFSAEGITGVVEIEDASEKVIMLSEYETIQHASLTAQQVAENFGNYLDFKLKNQETTEQQWEETNSQNIYFYKEKKHAVIYKIIKDMNYTSIAAQLENDE